MIRSGENKIKWKVSTRITKDEKKGDHDRVTTRLKITRARALVGFGAHRYSSISGREMAHRLNLRACEKMTWLVELMTVRPEVSKGSIQTAMSDFPA